MKKYFFMAALLLAAVSVKAEKVEAIGKDTVAFNGKYELKQEAKTNSFGETRVTYQVVLQAHDSETGAEKSKKKTISKQTYADLQAGKQVFLVYTSYEDGSERITKVIAK